MHFQIRFSQGRRLLTTACGLALTLSHTLAFAATIAFPINGGQLPPLSLPKSIPVPIEAPYGQVVAQATFEPGMSTDGGSCIVSQTTGVNGEPVLGSRNTYKTNVPGIGVRFYITGNWNNTWEQAPTISQFQLGPAGATEHDTRADLVVIGPVSRGTLTDLPSMTVTLSGTCITPVVRTQYIKPGTLIH